VNGSSTCDVGGAARTAAWARGQPEHNCQPWAEDRLTNKGEVRQLLRHDKRNQIADLALKPDVAVQVDGKHYELADTCEPGGARRRVARRYACARIRSVIVVHVGLTASGIGAAVPLLTLLLGLLGQLPGLTVNGRIASRIKEIRGIIEVGWHSEEADNAKRRLQEELDALVLRYVAVTVIRLSRCATVTIICAYAVPVAIYSAIFMNNHLPDDLEDNLQGLLHNRPLRLSIVALILVFLPNLPLLVVFFLFRRRQVNRELFICLGSPPLDQFHKHPALEWRDYFSSPKVAADRIYKRMSYPQKQAAPEGP
jgi:hypothetical protein